MVEILDQQISSLIKATDESLWTAYQCAIDGEAPQVGKLVFPKNSKGKTRVSEQEARQLLIANLGNTHFSFSIETPTLGNYGFSGKGKRNAMTDLTLYEPKGVAYLNMEFKAGNTSQKRHNRMHINKDMVKLVSEDVNGFWFHTLEATNSASVSNLWQTIRQELKTAIQDTGGSFSPKQLTFHCCVLKQAFSVQTTFQLDEQSRSTDWLVGVNPPSVEMKNGRLNQLQKTDCWTVSSQETASQVVTTEVP